ncbi:hypothetical protein ACEA31_21725, partial [Escherichia coli]
EPQTGRREVSALTDARKTLAYDFFRILRAPRNGSQLIRDFMRQTVERQHNTWFRDQVEAGRQQLKRGDVLPHDMVESSAAAWRDEMSRKVAGK